MLAVKVTEEPRIESRFLMGGYLRDNGHGRKASRDARKAFKLAHVDTEGPLRRQRRDTSELLCASLSRQAHTGEAVTTYRW